MASAECQSCPEDEVDRALYASTRLDSTPELSLSTSYKAYHNADSVLKHLLRSSDSPTPTVMNVTFELKRALEGHKTKRLSEGLMARPGAKDARAVNPHEYKLLIQVLLETFFPGTLPFHFTFVPKQAGPSYGDCTMLTHDKNERGAEYREARIRLHPFLYCFYQKGPLKLPDRFHVLNSASVSRLCTLLHEICHAYLEMYACHNCSRAGTGQFNGHGFAWQRVAYRVEAFATEKFDSPLKLGRFDSIVVHWKDLEILPGMEEMMRWVLDK